MRLALLHSFVTSRPGWIIALWASIAIAVGLGAPDLTRLAAEGQGNLLGNDAESLRAAEALKRAWPDQAYESLAVVALHRFGGLIPADTVYATRLAERIERPGRPKPILRVMGPNSHPEIAARLRSKDGTVMLVAVPLSTSFVAPATHDAVSWLESQTQAAAGLDIPEGLEVRWAGDAMIGRDYMAGVQISLDRAAGVTVVLLLGVLLAVYRSAWLAVIPIATIAVSLVISRGVLAWMNLAGWEISPLVELFLIAILFGSGTDFCLLISWRFGEHWDARDPAKSMRATLEGSSGVLLTCAATVIAGLSLMGTTRFKLFSSTGPSVALGLAITLAAALTLTPAMLVILAKLRPRSFAAMTGKSSPFWGRVARTTMARPVLCWTATVAVMAPLAVMGLRSGFVQDVMSEMPEDTISVKHLRWLASKFDAGELAPLTVVLDAGSDLRGSEGLALIDDLSRFFDRQRWINEVRSATQPLGSTAPLEPARLSERLRAVGAGNARIESGARRLQEGLSAGAAKLRAAIWIGERIGVPLGGSSSADPATLESTLGRAWAALTTERRVSYKPAGPAARTATANVRPADPRDAIVLELSAGSAGAGQIADGAARARDEINSMLDDPVGRRALNRLLVTKQTVREHPDLARSFGAYISSDGHRSRIELTQADRIYSDTAMDHVTDLRRRTGEFLGDGDGPRVTAMISGENAESADIRSLIRADQIQSWYVVPIGVFLVLMLTLRDPLVCLNLIATMLLTYAFALGATHLLFVSILGAEGIDWKVPYFLFVIVVAVGVDYNLFLMDRLREDAHIKALRERIIRAVGQTGGLITSAAAITVCSFTSFLFSPLGSLRQLGFALVVGIMIDVMIVRPVLVPCGHWLMHRRAEGLR